VTPVAAPSCREAGAECSWTGCDESSSVVAEVPREFVVVASCKGMLVAAGEIVTPPTSEGVSTSSGLPSRCRQRLPELPLLPGLSAFDAWPASSERLATPSQSVYPPAPARPGSTNPPAPGRRRLGDGFTAFGSALPGLACPIGTHAAAAASGDDFSSSPGHGPGVASGSSLSSSHSSSAHLPSASSATRDGDPAKHARSATAYGRLRVESTGCRSNVRSHLRHSLGASAPAK
jgi:hypothetical protein